LEKIWITYMQKDTYKDLGIRKALDMVEYNDKL